MQEGAKMLLTPNKSGDWNRHEYAQDLNEWLRGTEFADLVDPESVEVTNESGFRGARIRASQHFFHGSPTSSINWKTFAFNKILASSPEYEAYFNQLLSDDAKELICDKFDTKKVLLPEKILAMIDCIASP